MQEENPITPNTEETPESPGRWYRKLHYPGWSAFALLVALLLYTYMELKQVDIPVQVKVTCPASDDPRQLLEDDFSMTCTVDIVEGDREVKACWIVVYTCTDGRKVQAMPCIEVKPGETSSLKLSREKDFHGWEGCIATNFEVFLFNPEEEESP